MALVTDEYCKSCGGHWECVTHDQQEHDEFGLCKQCYENDNLYESLVKVDDEDVQDVWVDITDDSNVRKELIEKYGKADIKIIPYYDSYEEQDLRSRALAEYVNKQYAN